MPKKRRSDGSGNIVPIDTPERHKWKCDEKGCRAKGTAYTKGDAALAKALHLAMSHGKA